MRVFLDTNVLVSAAATRGLCADLLQVVLADHDLIVGEVVLSELQVALERKIKLDAKTIAELIAFLGEQGETVGAAGPVRSRMRDPSDRLILAEALAGKADVAITGDADLLVLGSRSPVPIRSPRQFWEMLRTR